MYHKRLRFLIGLQNPLKSGYYTQGPFSIDPSSFSSSGFIKFWAWGEGKEVRNIFEKNVFMLGTS